MNFDGDQEEGSWTDWQPGPDQNTFGCLAEIGTGTSEIDFLLGLQVAGSEAQISPPVPRLLVGAIVGRAEAVTFGHFGATNGADGSGHASNEAAGIEWRNGGRRGHDLINGCGVATAHTCAAAAGRG